MTFEDVNASVKHPAKSSEQYQPTLDQSNVFGNSQTTNTQYRVYNNPFETPQNFKNVPNNQEDNFRRQSSSSGSSNSYGYPTSPTYDRTSYSSSSSSSSYNTLFNDPHKNQKYVPIVNNPAANFVVDHESMGDDSKYRGLYKPKYILPDGNQPTILEQTVFNKLNDKDHVVQYESFILLFYFILLFFFFFIFPVCALHIF
jgi:hypothetical protein